MCWIRVFHHWLDLKHIKPEHIDTAHHIAGKKTGITRPITVMFLSRKTIQQFIQKRPTLKNTEPKVVIVEALTKRDLIQSLVLCALDHPGTPSVRNRSSTKHTWHVLDWELIMITMDILGPSSQKCADIFVFSLHLIVLSKFMQKKYLFASNLNSSWWTPYWLAL